MNSSFKFRHPTIIHEKFLKFLPSKDSEILICGGDYPIYLLQSDEEMINFFIIEVEENFNMESIDSIFHVKNDLFRQWVSKALSWMISGSLFSIKLNNMSINQVSEVPNWFRLIIGAASVHWNEKETKKEQKL